MVSSNFRLLNLSLIFEKNPSFSFYVGVLSSLLFSADLCYWMGEYEFMELGVLSFFSLDLLIGSLEASYWFAWTHLSTKLLPGLYFLYPGAGMTQSTLITEI